MKRLRLFINSHNQLFYEMIHLKHFTLLPEAIDLCTEAAELDLNSVSYLTYCATSTRANPFIVLVLYYD